MIDDDFSDDEMRGRVSLTRGAEIAHLLGRIETTLVEMRRDVQANTVAQADFTTRLELMDRRVGTLEGERQTRSRYGRIYLMIALALLVPALNWAQQLHNWFMTVNNVCFPRK